jgi:hypothetical protein
MYERPTDDIDKWLCFGAEYFDLDALDGCNTDGCDWFTRHGMASVEEARTTVYRPWTGDMPRREYAPRHDRELCAGYHPPLGLNASAAPTLDDPRVTVHAFAGIPRTVRKPSEGRANSIKAHVSERAEMAELANKDRQKVQRYARKHGVTYTAAMGALRASGKIA